MSFDRKAAQDMGRIWAQDPQQHGSASWADPDHLLQRGYGPWGRHTLGFLPSEDTRQGALPITYGGDRHQLIVAPTRGGKGVSGAILRALEHPGSMIVIDNKDGEIARITARYRRDVLGQNVVLIDPFDVVASALELDQAQINPMRRVDLDGDDAFDDAMLLASSLVVPSGPQDTHWDAEAASLLAGLILREAELGGTLVDVRAALNRDADAFVAYVNDMAASAYPLVQAAAGRIMSKEAREFSGVLSTAHRNTHFLESGKLAASLSGASVALSDIGEGTTIFLIQPARRIGTSKSYLRLQIAYFMDLVMSLPARPSEPVLFLLEEMATLGRMAQIEQAFGLMAGFGLQILAVIQDFTQLRDLYRDRWQTFVANAATVQCFGTNDHFTAEYLSKLAGTGSVETLSYDSAERRAGLFSDPYWAGTADRITGRALIMPDELMSLPPHVQFIALAGARPAMAYRPAYFLDARFRGRGGVPLYDNHPNHAHLPIPGAYDFTAPRLELDELLPQYLKVG